MAQQNLIDKTARIVFASNVPTDMAEDRIKEFFGKVGTVLSFRIICEKDKDTGKTKAYVICEYKDQEIALNAVKVLRTMEVAGRYIKVNHALVENTRLEMISVMQHAQSSDSSSEKTPETISKAVASLPPEQMFELLKQMKQCVQNNAGEAKNMLLQNPQLAYALLQALVVMRVVDPLVAVTALNNSSSASIISSASGSDSTLSASSMINRISSSAASESKSNIKAPVQAAIVPPPISRLFSPVPPPAPSMPYTPAPAASVAPAAHDVDLRAKPVAAVVRVEPEKMKPVIETYKRDPRLQHQTRTSTAAPSATPLPVPGAPRVPPATTSAPTSTPINTGTVKPATTPATAENEKAALIMQVLRLTDAQIAMLPPEQRQSILLLKEQIAKSTKR